MRTRILIVCFGLVASHVSAIDLWQYTDRPQYMYTVGDVEPIGWSYDGHFAYRIERTLAGIGGTRYEFAIVNAVTDDIAYFERWDDTAEIIDPDGGPPESSIDEAERRFADALGEYGIVPGRGDDFLELPVTVSSGRYTVSVTTVPASVETTPMDYIEAFEARVVREINGVRTSKRITGSQDIRGADIVPLGAFLSPFEPRMLIVLGREAYVFEGTEAFYHFSGSHLTYGFR